MMAQTGSAIAVAADIDHTGHPAHPSKVPASPSERKPTVPRPTLAITHPTASHPQHSGGFAGLRPPSAERTHDASSRSECGSLPRCDHLAVRAGPPSTAWPRGVPSVHRCAVARESLWAVIDEQTAHLAGEMRSRADDDGMCVRGWKARCEQRRKVNGVLGVHPEKYLRFLQVTNKAHV